MGYLDLENGGIKMPVQKATKNGKPGYKWGKSGTVYIYTPGDEESRKRAKKKAEKQGKAVYSTGWREK